MTTPRIALLLALAACNGGKSTTQTTPVQGQLEPATLPSGTRGDSTESTTPLDVPSYVTAIRPMLAARHTEDLPGRQALDAHEGALDGLIWLNANGETMAERVRATDLLGLYTEDSATAALMASAQDEASHPSLIAAAIRGLGAQGIEGRPEVISVIKDHLRHEDRRVYTHAIAVLQASDETRAEVQAILDDETYPQAVRDAAVDTE